MKLSLTLIALVFVAGCTVSVEDTHKSIEYCEPHGGLKYIAITPATLARCTDGVGIQL